MNKSFLEHYMKTKPETKEQKYLFLVDNLDIAYALIYAGYPAIFLINESDAYHSADSFIEYMDDKTNAYYRRLLVLDINRAIPEEQKDSQLKEKMCKESDYAIHMAMLALKELYTDNHFAESDHSKECIAILYRSADSVKAFTDDMLCHKVGKKMKRSDVYKMYEEYCEDNGRTPHGKSRFWEYMADKGLVIKRFSDGVYYFKDTSAKESDFETIDDTIANPFEQMDLTLL